jgi:hypothetical protein
MKADLKKYIDNIEQPAKKADALTLISLMEKASGYSAYLSGSIIGFGQYHYKYDSGREGDSCVTGFSPRKSKLTIYITPGFDAYTDELAKLGKHKTTVSCLYVNKLDDIDLKVLSKIVKHSVGVMKKRYSTEDIK